MEGFIMLILIFGLFLIMNPINIYSADVCSCSGENPVVGSSVKIRGRFSAWNGNPTFRIWVVGTKRILGVRDGTKLPNNLHALLDDFDTKIMGDFVVCPLTKPKHGVMQIVCVSSASNLRRDKKSIHHAHT